MKINFYQINCINLKLRQTTSHLPRKQILSPKLIFSEQIPLIQRKTRLPGVEIFSLFKNQITQGLSRTLKMHLQQILLTLACARGPPLLQISIFQILQGWDPLLLRELMSYQRKSGMKTKIQLVILCPKNQTESDASGTAIECGREIKIDFSAPNGLRKIGLKVNSTGSYGLREQTFKDV